MNTLLLADRALAGVIHRLEQLRRQVGRRAARTDDQRCFIVELEHLEDQVADVCAAEHSQRRVSDGVDLMKDLRRTKAKAQKISLSRRAAQMVQARIAAATTSVLVDVFNFDHAAIKNVSCRL